MDAVHCRQHDAQSQGSLTRKRPTADAFSRLAKLMALVEHKQEDRAKNIPKACPSKNVDCGREFLDVTSLVSHHQKKDSLHKLYSCRPCSQDQQEVGCQPAPSVLKGFASPSSGCSNSPSDTPAASCASSKPFPSAIRDKSRTCNLCFKTLRSAAGLACHKRLVHQHNVRKNKTTELEKKAKGPQFPCRSCDKVFTQTSTLYLHRKAEHRRERSLKKPQKSSIKSTRQRKKGETYPCLHCGKVFLHHLTRWAHFKSYSNHYQTHIKNVGKSKENEAGKVTKAVVAAKGYKQNGLPKPTKDSKLLPKRTTRGETGDDEDPEAQDEIGNETEFPCPSCTEVLNTPAALREHEKVHQPPCASDHCSVCTRRIVVPTTTEYFFNRVYHCVPCEKAFVDLFCFLQHCQAHFPLTDDNESDKDELSDN